ncbi:hypothetical protein L218DRAFT_947569 [Marasmius fiardii PR-910]|nr:hypothetical protein L218DRAFT_947569 [Marasmius fiardii PR-910]
MVQGAARYSKASEVAVNLVYGSKRWWMWWGSGIHENEESRYESEILISAHLILSASFDRHTLAVPAARHLLELSPTGLTHLDIRLNQDVDGFTETLLLALIISDTSSVVVPNLTSLSVTIVQGKPLVMEKIAKLIVDMMTFRRRRNLGERDDLAGRTSALANAVFDFRYLLTIQSEMVHRVQGDKDSRFLEIISSAQLDSKMTLHVLVGSRR